MSDVATDILLYMSAQNELASYAMENIRAIEECGNLENISAYVMLDKFTEDQFRETEVFAVAPGTKLADCLPVKWPDKEVTDPRILTRFLNRALSHFGTGATKQKILIFWGHGGGVQMLDERGTEIARANIAGFASALEAQAAPGGNVLKFDIIAFDACYMCMVETMFELKNSASYALCSSTVVDARGYPYQEIITGLKTNGPTFVPKTAASFIADTYDSYYRDLLEDPDRFLFICDMSKTESCVKELNLLGEKMSVFMGDTIGPNSVRSAISQAHIEASTGLSYVFVLRFLNALSDILIPCLSQAEHDIISAQMNRLTDAVTAAFQGNNLGGTLDQPISPQVWAPILIAEFENFEPIYNSLRSSKDDQGNPGKAGWVSMWRKYHLIQNVQSKSRAANDLKLKFEMALPKGI